MKRVRTSIQSIINQIKIREKELIEGLIHEEQNRLKQLNVLQHDIHTASTLMSSIISQPQQQQPPPQQQQQQLNGKMEMKMEMEMR